MRVILELLAALSSGIFTGAAFYIYFVEHPARLECGPALGVPEFAASYKRAKIMQPLLAFLGFFGGSAAWLTGAGVWWLIGGIIMGSLFPFTIILMLPINNELNNPSLDKNSPLAVELLSRWGNLHRIRALASLVAFVLFLLLLRWA
ncbi:MAG: DUF1772 domain-containing protein [Desulfobaccales bacterium]